MQYRLYIIEPQFFHYLHFNNLNINFPSISLFLHTLVLSDMYLVMALYYFLLETFTNYFLSAIPLS